MPAFRSALLLVLSSGLAGAAPQPPAPGQPVLSLAGHASEVYAVAFSPDGKRLASATNQQVKIWDSATGKELLNYPTRNTNVFGLAFSPDGKQLAVGVSKEVRIVDADTGKDAAILRCGPHFIFRLAFSPDGKRVAAAGGNNGALPGDVHVWDIAASKEVLTLAGHTEPPLNVTYSADGKQIISCSGATTGNKAGEVRVWDATTGKNLHVLRGHTWNVFGVSVSADGRRIASGSGDRVGNKPGEVKLWEAATAREVLSFTGHTAAVYSVAFSPDGRRLASAGADKTLKLWDTMSGKEALSLPAHTSIIYSVAYSPDGKRVATAGQDRIVKVWEVSFAVPANVPLAPVQLEACWTDLGSDGVNAYRALWSLVGAPAQSLPHLSKQLQPVPDLAPGQKEKAIRWIKDLDHRRFPLREEASRELGRLGEAVVPVLKHALDGNPPLEVRRRVQDLLGLLTGMAQTPAQRQALRGVEVLEHIASADARQLLEKLAAGLPGARLTEEARSSLTRLARRP